MEELTFNASAIALPPSGPIPVPMLKIRNRKIKQNLNTHQIEHLE
jgi:hypothetical protein